MPSMKHGRRIRDARIAAKLSRSDLAAMVGIDYSVMGRIERDEVGITTDRLVLIARLLNTTAAKLLGETPTERAAS